MKTDKWYKHPVIRQISTRDIMYSTINIVNTVLDYTGKLLRINPKRSHHMGKIFFSISLLSI